MVVWGESEPAKAGGGGRDVTCTHSSLLGANADTRRARPRLSGPSAGTVQHRPERWRVRPPFGPTEERKGARCSASTAQGSASRPQWRSWRRKYCPHPTLAALLEPLLMPDLLCPVPKDSRALASNVPVNHH